MGVQLILELHLFVGGFIIAGEMFDGAHVVHVRLNRIEYRIKTKQNKSLATIRMNRTSYLYIKNPLLITLLYSYNTNLARHSFKLLLEEVIEEPMKKITTSY